MPFTSRLRRSVGRCATSLKLASLDFFPFRPKNLWQVDLWQVYYVFYSITFVPQNTDPTQREWICLFAEMQLKFTLNLE